MYQNGCFVSLSKQKFMPRPEERAMKEKPGNYVVSILIDRASGVGQEDLEKLLNNFLEMSKEFVDPGFVTGGISQEEFDGKEG